MIRRFAGLIWGPDSQVELVRDWSQSPPYLWPKMGPLLAWLEERGFGDWHDIGRDPKVEAHVSLNLPPELSGLDFCAHPITVYAGPAKPTTGGQSAILELGLEALEAALARERAYRERQERMARALAVIELEAGRARR